MTEEIAETLKKKKKKMGRPSSIENPRAYILKISAKFFGQNGYERSTIAQLANGMNMSKAFIYHYFSSKEQLLSEITLDTQQRLIEQSKERVALGDGHIEQIRMYMLSHADFIQDNYYEMRALDYSFAGQMSKEVEVAARKNNTEYRKILTDIFRDGIERGAIKSGDAVISAQAVFSVVHSISRWYQPASDPNPAAHYAEQFFKIISFGIVPDRKARSSQKG